MAQSNYILSNLRKIAHDVTLAGGKAQNLARLQRAGFNVPQFFVISTQAFQNKLLTADTLKPQLQKQLEHIQKNKSERIAARSSSTLEDSAFFSFAGQYESFVNLENVDDISDAIEKIWQSAEKEAVSGYAKKHAVEDRPSIAVIIQKMIQAQVSGVLFTTNPVTNSDETMMLEIVDGGGEKLVSGQETPLRITIKRKSQSFNIEGNREPSRAMQYFLTHKNGLSALRETGNDIEQLFGEPQDIEWTFDGERLWILQSRPVSTREQQNTAIILDQDGQRWSRYFFAERFVEPISPLGWSFLKPVIRKTALQDPLWFLGYNDNSSNVQLKLIDGLPVASLSAYQKLYSHVPWSLISDDKKQTLALKKSQQQKIGIRTIFSLLSRLILRDPGWLPPVNLWQWTLFSKKMKKKTTNALDSLADYNPDQCYNLFEKTHEWSLQFLKLHRWSITFADIFSALLKVYLEKAKLEEHVSIEKLLSGLPNNATVQANQALLKLDLSSQNSLAHFNKEFGHRSESLDIATTTWGENKKFVAKMSDALKSNRNKFSENFRHTEKERLEVTNQILKMIEQQYRFSSLMIKAGFRFLLYYAQQFTILRENQRNTWHKILRVARFSVLAIANKLVEQNTIEQSDDIFYLQRNEIAEIVKQNTPGRWHTIIERRKHEYQNFLQSKNHYSKKMPATTHEKTGKLELSGIGVSAGKIQGRARIARSYAEAMQAEPGDILIVPSADPAWSPIFGIVAGLVMERGGILSHASIVAREFRLPAITNVVDATEKIKQGSEITIDGEQGILSVLME